MPCIGNASHDNKYSTREREAIFTVESNCFLWGSKREEPCGAAQVNFSGLVHPNVCKLPVSISVTDTLTVWTYLISASYNG